LPKQQQRGIEMMMGMGTSKRSGKLKRRKKK
jgi:hypothetical protein